MIIYNCNKATGNAGRRKTMEDEMNKADLIAILTSILQVAETNGESKTAEHIKRILEEVRK